MGNTKKETVPASDYNRECKILKENGPKRLYFINGQEDYLSEYLLDTIKKVCIPDGDNGFNYKKFDEYDFNADDFSSAVDSLPFLSDRTLIELRSIDLNSLPSEESEKLIKIIGDIPDYCTVVFFYSGVYQRDGRLKLSKKMKESAYVINFATQPKTQLISWVKRRFAAWNKSIDLDAIEELFLVSGEKMKDLIPEIDKIASYCTGNTVSVSDVDKVANRIPSAVVFEVAEKISGKDLAGALRTFKEYTNENKNTGIPSLGLFSSHFRKLYMIRYCMDNSADTSAVKNLTAAGKDFIYNKMCSQARSFSLSRLESIINLLAEADYRCKSSGEHQDDVAVNALVDIIGGVAADDKNKRSDPGRGTLR